MAAFGDAVEKTAAQMGIDGDKAEMLRKMAAYLEYKAPDMAVMVMMCMGMGAGLANVVAARGRAQSSSPWRSSTFGSFPGALPMAAL